jgi:hypothetical protein
MLPPQDAGPAIRDLKQTRPTVTRAKPGLGDAIHAVTLSERRGPRRTRADPPFGAADWRVRVAPVWAQIPVICAPTVTAARCSVVPLHGRRWFGLRRVERGNARGKIVITVA